MLIIVAFVSAALAAVVVWMACRGHYTSMVLAADTKSQMLEAERNDARDRASSTDGQLRAAEKQCAALEATLTEVEKRIDDQKEVLRQDVIKQLTEPITATLREFGAEASKLEKTRIEEFSNTRQRLEDLLSAKDDLGHQVTILANALRSNTVRGNWGQIALRRLIELTGMTPYCDFVEQESVRTEDGRLRPDVVVKMPARREILIDSKAPGKFFFDSLEASDKDRKELLIKHAASIKQFATDLSSKEYWAHFESPEFVVMFIPNDTFLAAAAVQDPDLIEGALAKRVVIATPATLYALLRAIESGWRQEEVAENAKKIGELANQLFERIVIWLNHFERVGQSLGKATEAYNNAIGSYEDRVAVSARKLQSEFGILSSTELPNLLPVEKAPRALAAASGDKEG